MSRRLAGSLLLLLGIAVGTRIAWELLNPVLPSLMALLFVVLLGAVVLQWRS